MPSRSIVLMPLVRPPVWQVEQDKPEAGVDITGETAV
jgi:hypothetical protein